MIITGSTGMLGSMVTKTVRGSIGLNRNQFKVGDKIPDEGRIINCIGLIKFYCKDIEQAIRVNALFPHTLPSGTIQIATDCVYSGTKGDYTENSPHDATDIYGKTKSLGEAEHLKNLRCSIIGPEIKNHISLLDWFLQQDSVNGFTNHLWNGVTTYHFAKIVKGVIENNLELPSLQHIVPADKVTKSELLQIIAKAYNKDVIIRETEAPVSIDRTLATNNPELNLKLWQNAGYDSPPTIEQMVTELAQL